MAPTTPYAPFPTRVGPLLGRLGGRRGLASPAHLRTPPQEGSTAGTGGPGDDVVVVANFAERTYSGYTVGFPREGRWRVRFNSDWTGYDPSFGRQHAYDTDARPGERDGLPFHGDVGLGPYSALILSQDG